MSFQHSVFRLVLSPPFGEAPFVLFVEKTVLGCLPASAPRRNSSHRETSEVSPYGGEIKTSEVWVPPPARLAQPLHLGSRPPRLHL
jgi:hypothetical protein